ncbi:hypothetical protein DTO013E5_2422 [Penicillium roqueforti]|uniref:Genomic scaffold, ProqFM164S02 n=1 Tax=Penicillium roqueforti (strain FM164) TaxID=1365484 RepID=W6QM45_PENRF|nr:hypothetical protein CBS147355_3636 [Penicillium roqueforti]CDM30642.1 unnamed protein product [Penicillium roqueforti FM164]KAI2690955.1 hypothetical protein LCP963914a_1156 [Penicillium roqueforti]KAI2723723.1 hypothetical protein CBS147318_654 [Penicillium roqueforti]KAI2744564.1 hypothetical protein DTO012A1_2564 [Penicillium roqueforti]
MADSVAQTIHGYEHDNLRHVVVTSTCFAFILSTTAVGFRIISRKINGSGLFVDDWLIIIALIFEYGISIAGVVLLYNGLGTHIVEISPEQLVIYLKTLFTGSILYTGCIASIKLSILMLYRRLFPVKSMKYAVSIVSLIVILWAACGILAGCFICIPTEKLWHPMLPGGCMNLSKFYYGLQVPNIATDAIILLMPMHIVWNLPISKVQKLGLSGIFILGVLTLIFDIIRLVVLIQLSTQGEDITYNQVPASVWTCIEPAVGIVAACLSNMRPLFKVIHTKVWSRLSSRYATHTNNPSDSQINEKGVWPRQTPSPSNSPSPSGDFDQSPTHNQSAV